MIHIFDAYLDNHPGLPEVLPFWRGYCSCGWVSESRWTKVDDAKFEHDMHLRRVDR